MENQPTPPNTFDHLFSLEKIERHHLQHLSPDEKGEFNNQVQQKMLDLKDEELDDFIQKIAPILDNDSLWEVNHGKITGAIAAYIEMYGEMPSKVEISEKTGLSARTVRNHMKNYTYNPAYKEQADAFNFMAPKVLGVVMKQALKGDLKAAKLFLNSKAQVSNQVTNDIVIKNQHNYIQINNTVLSQELIQKLKPEELLQIEQIIQKSLPDNKE